MYVRVNVRQDEVFTRHGNDILSQTTIPYSVFALGGKVDIQTIDGAVSLKIPSNTKSGTKFKLRGKGVPFLRGYGRGDHLVTVYPEVPNKISREQKKILQELQKTGL